VHRRRGHAGPSKANVVRDFNEHCSICRISGSTRFWLFPQKHFSRSSRRPAAGAARPGMYVTPFSSTSTPILAPAVALLTSSASLVEETLLRRGDSARPVSPADVSHAAANRAPGGFSKGQSLKQAHYPTTPPPNNPSSACDPALRPFNPDPWTGPVLR
jgi:hypothetical protein